MTNNLVNLMVKGYNLLISAGNLLQPLVLLAFRLAWGIEFFVSGRGKLKNHSDIVDFFTSLHIPFPDLNAWFVGGLECVGGVLLILGFMSRPIGLLLTVNMTVAYLSVDSDRALVFHALNSTKDWDAFTKADPYFFLVTSIIVLAFGSGVISVDHLLAKTVFKSKAKTSVPSAPSAGSPAPSGEQAPASPNDPPANPPSEPSV